MAQPSTHKVTDPRQWLSYVPQTLERLSPLYAHLYRNMQQDPELFALLSLIDPDQPIPVLFFTAINFLLFGDMGHEFAQFYPALNAPSRPPSEAYPSFQRFCHAHLDELQSLLPLVRLQTNEVRRCTQLLPAFELVSQRGGRKPLALLELGASAGLNLNWNQYGYHYNRSFVGDHTSPVQIHCTLSGDSFPLLPDVLPTLAQCQGIELFPLDITDEQDIRWLRSCIWPEEEERYHLLDAALTVAQQHLPQLLRGNACELLPSLLATIPAEQTICIWHSFALNQGSAEVRERVIQTLVEASTTRTLYRISLEANPLKQEPPRLELFTYRKGDLFHYEWLAACDFHGESMEWLCS